MEKAKIAKLAGVGVATAVGIFFAAYADLGTKFCEGYVEKAAVVSVAAPVATEDETQ